VVARPHAHRTGSSPPPAALACHYTPAHDLPPVARLGRATTQNADAYERIVREQVIPGIEARRIPGFRSIDLARGEREHDVEFMTLMWFDSLDAVKAFTGDDYEVAHVPAEAQAVLADFDKRSAHYQVLDHRDQPR